MLTTLLNGCLKASVKQCTQLRPSLSLHNYYSGFKYQHQKSSMSTVVSASSLESEKDIAHRPNHNLEGMRRNKKVHKPYENYAPVLFEWSQKVSSGELTMDRLLNSQQYFKVSNAVCDTTRHSDKNILNLIKSLIVMNFDQSSRMVQFLEDELLFKVSNYDYKLLVSTFILYNPIQDTSSKRKDIVSMIKQRINENLDNSTAEIGDLIQLIKLSQHLSPETLIKIEEQTTRILDGDENIPLDILCYLLVLLSRYNRRNKPLIRTVVNKLIKYNSDEIYSMPPHLIHMISSLNRLNYPEVNLLEKCSDILINTNFLESTSDSSKRDFIVAISNFNFSYPKLFDYYLQTLLDKPEIFKRQDLTTLTITLARLHCQNEEMVDIIRSHIVPKCSVMDEYQSKYQWFNFVYSLVLLRCATVDQIRPVLDKKFLEQMEHEQVENYLLKAKDRQSRQAANAPMNVNKSLEETSEEADLNEPESSSVQATSEDTLEVDNNVDVQNIYRVMNLRRKYLTMCGLLKTDVTHYSELKNLFNNPDEKAEFDQFINSLEFTSFKRSRDLQNFRENIFKTLESYAPKDRYFEADVKTPYGFYIDAELLVDQEGNAQKLNKPGLFSDASQVQSEDSENNNNYRRVALMCIGFNDTLLDDGSTLIGPKEAQMRILRSLGYVTIPVHQNSIPPTTTSLNRVRFLQNLIVSHLNNQDNCASN